MPLRLLVFRSVLLPCRSTSSSSLSTILHVKMNKSNDISIGNVCSTPAPRRRVSVDGILGIQQRPNASATASNNTRCSSSVTNNESSIEHMSKQAKNSTSDMSVSCSKTPESGDVDHEDKCSLPSENSGGSSSRQGSLEENEFLPDVDSRRMLEKWSLPTSFGKVEPSQSNMPKLIKHGLKNEGHIRSKDRKNKNCAPVEVFDICRSEAEDFMHPSSVVNDIFEEAEERMDELSVEREPAQIVLRPGMILLKNYISFDEQVSIIKKCRELGIGPGGFYRPGYKDGAKLRLHMMCLGRDWDPQTRKYGKIRRIDKCKPPDIPLEFRSLVERAMLDSFTVVRRESGVSNAEDILPQMNPDICIINFYSETGRLGLHQDRDESRESLAKGVPVVSVSLGDSAEFLYGDHRNPNKAENLMLESGDVLIFGGQSRHVFHGVSSIIPDSAPPSLLQETRLLPGRLNLTFRQY